MARLPLAPLGVTARARTALGLIAAGAVFTVATWRAPGFDVAYGAEGMHIALQAIVGTISLGVGWLAWSRYGRSRMFDDLAVAVAFGVLIAGDSVGVLMVPTLLDHELLPVWAVWSSAAIALAAASVLLAGTVFSTRRLRRVHGVVFVAACAAVVGGAIAAVLTVGPTTLPIDPALSPVANLRHVFTGSPVLLGLEGATALVLLAAAVGFLRRQADARDSVLFGWLGPALAVAALASANYALFPSLYSYWVYSGDVLQLVSSLLLVVGTGFELRASVQRAIDVAVLQERRRLARDLHDGVAQELAFIATELRDLPAGALLSVCSAAERGLYEARRAIAALAAPLDRALEGSLAESAEELADRTGVPIDLDIESSLTLTPLRNEAVLRVAREALLNATRHAKPTRVRISLKPVGYDGAQLEIRDDGGGIAAGSEGSGFGLMSMRERTETTGGRLSIASAAGVGTTILAVWPPTSANSRRQAARA